VNGPQEFENVEIRKAPTGAIRAAEMGQTVIEESLEASTFIPRTASFPSKTEPGE
jgi:hypothetical protein